MIAHLNVVASLRFEAHTAKSRGTAVRNHHPGTGDLVRLFGILNGHTAETSQKPVRQPLGVRASKLLSAGRPG